MDNFVTFFGYVILTLGFYINNRVLSLPLKNSIYLEEISTTYLPHAYINGSGQYRYDAGSSEQLAFDSTSKLLYVVGGHILHVIDIHDLRTPPIVLTHRDFGNVDVTDIDVCGDYVIVAIDNTFDRPNGMVKIFKKYNRTTNELSEVFSQTVGVIPDMIKPTTDCRTIVVAIEAEAYSPDGRSIVDPLGGVGILSFPGGLADVQSDFSYTKLTFTAFNSRWRELVSRGVRFIYRGNSNTLAQDLEPEYIAFNDNETKAYICLQENNAIAEVDLINKVILDIRPLGFKSWKDVEYGLDASDSDGGIHLRQWDVKGIYQPDAVHVVKLGGVTYLLTANEGDHKTYDEIVPHAFTEVDRFKHLHLSDSSTLAQWAESHNMTSHSLKANENLGRLKVSVVDGVQNHVYNEIYTYGGRGLSLFNLDTMTLAYDSGAMIEEGIKMLHPDLFNANSADSSSTIAQTVDKRSDDKGPECESLAHVETSEGLVVFLGIERPGLIAVVTLKHSGPTGITAQLESIFSGIPRVPDATWESLYNQRSLSMVDPEDIKFVPANQSPNHRPLLLSTGTVSGTVSILQVHGLTSDTTDGAGPGAIGK